MGPLAPALLALLAACSAEPPPAPKPSIVLVTIDTLRRDHCSTYGYFRETTPNLDEFAAEAVVFERAYAPIATTLPAHLSLLTGQFVHEHGFPSNLAAVLRRFRPRKGCRSAAELLARDGYATAAFVSARTLNGATGIAAGFEVFDDGGVDERSPQETVERACAWLAEPTERPRFLWVHLWGPHEPNQPPPPFDAAFTSSPELDALLAERRVDPERLARAQTPFTIARSLYPELLDESMRPAGSVPPPSWESVRELYNRYDGEVLCHDHWLGVLLERLRELGLWDEAIVAIAGDHGQGLGQHDDLEHGEVTEESLRVPLLIRFPARYGVAPRRVAELASLVDVLPTVLARGPERARERLARQASGHDLLGGRTRGFTLAQRPARERHVREGGQRQAVITERWKLVLDDGSPAALFDLASDPGELRDVLAEHGDAAERLARLAPALVPPLAPEGGAVPEAQPDPELLEALERLGYTGY